MGHPPCSPRGSPAPAPAPRLPAMMLSGLRSRCTTAPAVGIADGFAREEVGLSSSSPPRLRQNHAPQARLRARAWLRWSWAWGLRRGAHGFARRTPHEGPRVQGPRVRPCEAEADAMAADRRFVPVAVQRTQVRRGVAPAPTTAHPAGCLPRSILSVALCSTCMHVCERTCWRRGRGVAGLRPPCLVLSATTIRSFEAGHAAA